MKSLEVLFTPAEFRSLPQQDLSGACCVVFDVLRATSTMVTALANGAAAILPVEEIREALAARAHYPNALLAGEREGVRIGPALTDGTTFDLGNSPREFTSEIVSGRTIIMSTTNGTRALRACLRAQTTLIGSFVNLSATAAAIERAEPARLVVVCSGTGEQAAYEDVLAAGALCQKLWPRYREGLVADSAQVARQVFLTSEHDLKTMMSRSRNARRLLSILDLEPDVAFCLQTDSVPLVAAMDKNGLIRRG